MCVDVCVFDWMCAAPSSALAQITKNVYIYIFSPSEAQFTSKINLNVRYFCLHTINETINKKYIIDHIESIQKRAELHGWTCECWLEFLNARSDWVIWLEDLLGEADWADLIEELHWKISLRNLIEGTKWFNLFHSIESVCERTNSINSGVFACF